MPTTNSNSISSGAARTSTQAKKPTTANSVRSRSSNKSGEEQKENARPATNQNRSASIGKSLPLKGAKSRQSAEVISKGSGGKKLNRENSIETKSDLTKSMPAQQSPPLKGILKKPKPGLHDQKPPVAASDDEQIRRINFQHTLQMMHQERRDQGFFPDGTGSNDGQELVTSTAPQNLGISLLRASATNRTGDQFSGAPQEVVLNAQPSTKPPDPSAKPINYKHLDWAFREFMKIQEDMIARGHIDSAIKNLEEALNERLAIYPAKDEGVWKIAQLLGDVSVKTAVRHINNNNLDLGMQYLKQARKFTEPLPNSDWKENAEWIGLRKSVLKNQALYHQKNEEWTKALDLFKLSMQLDNSPVNPDPVGAANTSLTCAVILSKLNRYAESNDYAGACRKAIEEHAGIDTQTPLVEYKRTLVREGGKANGGKMPDQDKVMTTYSICLHLLGKNLANLKYFKESRVFLQRAQYVAQHLTVTPKNDLVNAITNDISNLSANYKRPIGEGRDSNDGGKLGGTAIEDMETVLESIKTNIANSSYSLAADFQEQKAMISQLLDQKNKAVEEEKKIDDQALGYVKQFIEEKKQKERVEIDEYRSKIQKEFDDKQKEFHEKQQKMKEKKQVIADKKAGPVAKPRAVSTNAATVGAKKPDKLLSSRQGSADGPRAIAKTLPINRNLVKTPNVNDRNAKPGDFEGAEKQTRIKKPDHNLAAEGAKLDNLAMKYSSERGDKTFLQKRRVNIEKVNEKLGFFGGGILEAPENKEVVLEAAKNEDDMEYEGNPFEDQNMTAQSKKSIGLSSPQKPPKGVKAPDGSAVKLPPVKGYKLDQLALTEVGENIMKKTMDHVDAVGATGHTSYKNPHTRKLIHSLDSKDKPKDKRPASKQLDKAQKEESKQTSPQPAKKSIREIPTYQPPSSAAGSDWREEFKNGNNSDEELPDTKKLMHKLGVSGAPALSTALDIEEDAVRASDNSIMGGDMNDSDVAMLKRQVEEQENKLAELQAKLNKPPKGTAKKGSTNAAAATLGASLQGRLSQQSSGRLPQIAKRFREDKTTSPDKGNGSSKASGSPDKSRNATSLPPPTRDSQHGTTQSAKGKLDILSDTDKSMVGGVAKSQQSSKKDDKKADSSQGAGGSQAPGSAGGAYLTPMQRKQKKLDDAAAALAEEKAKLKNKVNKKPKEEEGKPKKVDEERLSRLAQPKPVKQPSAATSVDEQNDKEKGEEKAMKLISGVQRGKAVDFETYLDREVPAMSDKVKKKLSGPLPENKKEGESDGGDGARTGSRHSKAGDSTTGRKSKGTKDGESDAGASKQDSSLKVGQENSKGGLTLKGLREIENRAAVKIQKVVKGYFTRKWYLNYVTRRKLGVPFSGLEFAQHPFLRQFNLANQRLHALASQPPQLVQIVNSQAEQKNMLSKSIRHGNARSSDGRDLRRSLGGQDSNSDEDDNKSEKHPRRLKKGTTPQQVLDNLQKEFVAKGLDAYHQFKSMGIDALTDENGNPTFNKKTDAQTLEDERRNEGLKDQENMKKMSPRRVTKALDPLERMVPRWRGEKTSQFLEVKEVAQYLDRVSRMREYDEKQKEALQNQQYQEMAKQMKKHQLSTITSLAKAHGVFNHGKNPRNQEEDDEDFDPLQIRSPRPGPDPYGDPSGGGGGGGKRPGKKGPGGPGGPDDSGDDDGDRSDDNGKKKKKKDNLGLRNVPFTEEDGSIPLKMYQEFSREMIVFFKGINGMPMRWIIQAGIPYEKDKKLFLPIKMFGEPLHSRNLIVNYVMNLELLRIQSDYYQYNTHTFETIWPFILYLFNNWVRHQVRLMRLTNEKPLFGPDEFMAPDAVQKPSSPKTLAIEVDKQRGMIHQNNFFGPDPGAMADEQEIEQALQVAKQEYDDMLNFSSEIEYDERFELEKYSALAKIDEVVDRSAPSDKRMSTVALMRSKKKQLFKAYRMQLQDEKKALIGGKAATTEKVKYARALNKQVLYQAQQHIQEAQAEEEEEGDEEDDDGKPGQKRVKLQLDDIFEAVNIRDKNPFAAFLELNFVPLPNNQTSQYKLIKRLQQRPYMEREKANMILPRENLNLMNEERRRRQGLLPLTVIDYNCMDRAAVKLKIVLDCLYMRRQLNGWTLVPRDVKEAYIDSEWSRRKSRLLRLVAKIEDFSVELKKAFGTHVVYAKQYNEQALMIEKSIQKIHDYKQRKQLRIPTYKENQFGDSADVMDQKNLLGPHRNRGPPAIKQGDRSMLTPNKPNDKTIQPPDLTTKSDSKSINEQPIMLSGTGNKLEDTTVVEEVEDKRKGLLESSRQERFRSGAGSEAGTRFNNSHKPNEDQEMILPADYEMQEIEGFNDWNREPDVQDYIRGNDIFDQGVIRIGGNLFLATLVFKKIESNYENMRALIEGRLTIQAPKSETHQIEMLRNYKGHLRLRSKTCEFITTDPNVLRLDEEKAKDISIQDRMMIDSEMVTKARTRYKTYLEIKVATKMSDTIWDDTLNMSWETLEKFYKKFGLTWRLNELLLRRQMTYRDRFTFFNFIGHCLSIKDTLLVYDPASFDFEAFKYNQIFLKEESIKRFRKTFPNIPFYYDDFLKTFDETEYDKPANPYYNIEKALERRKELLEKAKKEGANFDAAEMRPNYEKKLAILAGETVEDQDMEDDYLMQTVEVDHIEGERRKKPDLLIDEATKAYIMENPGQNMFNLTLTNYPQQDSLFLGTLPIGSADYYRAPFSLRIDYYSVGFIPQIQIRLFNCIYPEIYEMKLLHKQTIKSFIRICNLSQTSMTQNQLQSAITIGKKVVGRYMRLNFFKKGLYLSSGIGTQHGQDFINMAICNENLIRAMLNENYRQFSGIMFFDSLDGKSAVRTLVTVTEFEIDMFQQPKDHKTMIHMNKHLSLEQIHAKRLKKKGQPPDVEDLPPYKRYQKVKLWKLNLFNVQSSKNYDTVISHDDLLRFYETEFMEPHALKKADLLKLLQDYIRTLYVYRTKVGKVLYWKLPMYKRPIDPKTGLAIEIPPDQIYRLKMLDVYIELQKKIDGLNKYDDFSNVMPVSLEQMKAKRSGREPPSLSLRAKLVIEKELPVYEPSQSLQVLKVTSNIMQVLLQRPKYFKRGGSLRPLFANITILLHPMMECWIWQIYFPQNQRTFTATFYPSDLFNMDAEVFGGQNNAANGKKKKQDKNKSGNLWIVLVNKCELSRNQSGDVVLLIDTFKEPLKEILFQDHVYNTNARDMMFMELVIKSHSNFVTDIGAPFSPVENISSKVNEWIVHIRAFSLTRNIWIKDHMLLSEVMFILKKENYILDNLKYIYYSMIRDAATLLSFKIIFSGEAKTTEIKKRTLTYDMRTVTESREELEKIKQQHLTEQQKLKQSRQGLYSGTDKGLRTENNNMVDQNKIFFQSVVSKSPTQVCTIIYSDVKDLFIYRLYRATDQSTFEKRIPAADVAKTCAPQYLRMLVNSMFAQLGERISKYYLKDLLVASLMDYYKRRKDEEKAIMEQRRKIQQIKVLPGNKVVYPEGFKGATL